jgi:uncharacterized protein (TIGR03067 family)
VGNCSRELTWTRGGKEPVRLSFTIDSSKQPDQINFTFLDGPDKGKTCQGIYKFERTTLWICLTEPGVNGPRPEKMAMRGGESALLILHQLPKESPSGEKSLLQGAFRFELWTSEHWPAEPKEFHKWRWIVRDEKVTWERPGQETLTLSFSVDSEQTLPQIDFTFLNGPDKGQTCRGVYQASKDEVTICFQDPGADVERPTYLGTKPDSHLTGMRLVPARIPTVAEELKTLSGRWNFSLYYSDWWPARFSNPPIDWSPWRWLIKDHEIAWTGMPIDDVRLSFTLDLSKFPKQIDLTFLDGPFKGKQLHGIYKLRSGNRCEICVADPDAKVDRPTSFEYSTNAGFTWLSLEQIADEQRDGKGAEPLPDGPQINGQKAHPRDAGTVPVAPAASEAKELKGFQGLWAVDSCKSEAVALKVSEYNWRRWRWTIKGEEISWGRDGQEWKVKFKIDPAQSPPQIDLTFLDGPHKGEKWRGIYDWDRKEQKSLNILFQDPKAKTGRPTKFAWQAGSKTSEISLHQIPPADPKQELALFQGTWCFDVLQPWDDWPQPIGIGTDSDGRKSEKRWVVMRNQITWVNQEGKRIYVDFTIDPYKTPKQIDFKFLNGPHGGKKSIGIYEPQWGNDEYLWLCMTLPGADAPRPIDVSASSFKKQAMIGMYKVRLPEKQPLEKRLARFQGE